MSLYIDIYRWMDGWMDGGFKQHPPGWLMSPASGSFIIAGKAGNTEMGAEISRRIHMKREKFMRNHEKSLNSIIYIYTYIHMLVPVRLLLSRQRPHMTASACGPTT